MTEAVKEPEVIEAAAAVDAPEAATEGPKEPETQAQIVISILDNGGLDLSSPEGMPSLEEINVEGVLRDVYDKLRDARVANSAVEIFKQRLG